MQCAVPSGSSRRTSDNREERHRAGKLADDTELLSLVAPIGRFLSRGYEAIGILGSLFPLPRKSGQKYLLAGSVMLPWYWSNKMGQPVKLSDSLVCDARLTAEVSQRSIAGQIEFWAQLGRALEPLLRGDRAFALARSGAERSLGEAVQQVDTPAGRKRVSEYLGTRPFPHFEPVPGQPGLLRRIDEDATQTIGRFVNRVFVPTES